MDIDGLTAIFLSGHYLLSTLAGESALKIDETEAGCLATAVANVGRHYNLGASQKMLDHMNLVMVAGTIYGRIAVEIRRKANAPAENPPTPGPLPNGHAPPGPVFSPSMITPPIQH